MNDSYVLYNIIYTVSTIDYNNFDVKNNNNNKQ